VQVTELFNEYSILLDLIIEKESNAPLSYNFTSMNEAIWEIKPAHLNHSFNINNTRKIGIKAEYDDIKFKYFPCNTLYAGELQANTYTKEKELYNLPPSEPFKDGDIDDYR
jgi:hypothetical protein